ncbi:hypothetical protein [Nocardioides sp. LHG3406-4]|uniref:hypothetical protein n=1 Tax=Nocardioides sp. LHG3406-4 TaxID=2804575 RepID=UPI003CF68030
MKSTAASARDAFEQARPFALTLLFVSTALAITLWVVGPVGALLAVPLGPLVKAMLIESDPRTRWALPLISGTPAASEPPKPKATPEARRAPTTG